MKKNIFALQNAQWGVFSHYLASPASSTEGSELTVDEWNRRIDAFDVDGLATQLADVGAGYYFITLGQNTGFYLAPNTAYDEIVGRAPSRCSRRDLVSALYDALAPKGIKLLVYLPANAPIHDPLAIERLKFAPPWKDRDPQWCDLKVGDLPWIDGVDSRMSAFQRNWEAVIREWSLRWGEKVIGWWIDGVYHCDLMYDFPDEPNFTSFKAALRAGNSDALVSFAVKCGTLETGGHSDFTAGEMNYALPVSGKHIQVGGFVDGALYHLLTFLGEYWGVGEPRFSAELARGWMRAITSKGGVVSWDVPSLQNGRIPDSFLRILSQFNRINESKEFTGACPAQEGAALTV